MDKETLGAGLFWAGLLGIAGGLIGLAIYGTHREVEERERRLRESRPVVATVLKESYQNMLSPNPKWDGAVSYSNETVKLDSKYTLKVRTEDGRVLGVSIMDRSNITKESLDMLIDEGTRVQFPSVNIEFHKPWKVIKGETDFSEGVQVGTKYADRVRVLE